MLRVVVKGRCSAAAAAKPTVARVAATLRSLLKLERYDLGMHHLFVLACRVHLLTLFSFSSSSIAIESMHAAIKCLQKLAFKKSQECITAPCPWSACSHTTHPTMRWMDHVEEDMQQQCRPCINYFLMVGRRPTLFVILFASFRTFINSLTDTEPSRRSMGCENAIISHAHELVHFHNTYLMLCPSNVLVFV